MNCKRPSNESMVVPLDRYGEQTSQAPRHSMGSATVSRHRGPPMRQDGHPNPSSLVAVPAACSPHPCDFEGATQRDEYGSGLRAASAAGPSINAAAGTEMIDLDFAVMLQDGSVQIVPGGGWCNAGDCVPTPLEPAGPIGSPWGWLPFGLPMGSPF